MEYCGNCGEPAEGRFCRMCGAPVGDVTAQDTQAMAAVPAGHGAEATQAMVAVPAGYGGEPTQVVGVLPPATVQPPSEFDSLFRTPDGTPGPHGQTQVLPPVVETDYRMQPPGGGPRPPGLPGQEEQGTNRTVIIATVGAVVVAAGVILSLLFLGNHGSEPAASGTSTAQAAAAGASASQTPSVISVPTNGASPSPTAASSSATSQAAFHGDSLPLGPGSQGSLVKWVQEKLKQLGYYHGTVNGTFDQATALAVQQFQAAAGVTGDPASTVGRHTRLALAAAGSTPPLRPGAKSPDVSRLNQSLDYAESTGSLSGSRYTMTTAEAVAFYQQSVGLPPTGVMDAATWAKLQTGTLASTAFSGYGSGN